MYDKKLFDEFKKDLAEISDGLDLKNATSSNRVGIRKVRDWIVFLKVAWSESISYIAIIQTVIIFAALIPSAVSNVNGFFREMGLSYRFPEAISSLLIVVAIGFIMIFGIVTYRFFGLARRSSEISCLYNPGVLLYYAQFKDLKADIKRLENKLKEIENKE